MTEHTWLPAFVCIACSSPMRPGEAGGLSCSTCTTSIPIRDGIYRCLSETHLAEVEPFLRQYRLVRERDGYRRRSADYYRALPETTPDDPQAASWRVRRDSYRQLRRHVGRLSRDRHRALAILDLGAGNGWLSYRLAALGHRAVAVDWLDDDEDGLGAWIHYDVPFVTVQADFDRLSFERGQFDLIVFNGSLHYASNPASTLARAATLLATGGTLAVMDSPMFHDDDGGREMLARKDASFRADYGLTEIVRHGFGYLTRAALDAAARPLGLEPRFFASRGGARWTARRLMARIKLGREPAGFGVWVAR